MKSFFKQVSIYGMLPIAGKFVGFFLIPIYTRVFSTEEFGIVELIVTLAHFLMLACNLEFYTAIGRFFYSCNSHLDKQRLISTGLYLTLIFSVLVVIIAIFSEKMVLNYYLTGFNNKLAYRLSIVWIFLSSIYTYLGIIPRYDKKPKLYVIVNIVSLLVRVASTIVYVLYFKWGIVGVILGHITGSMTSLIFNIIITRKYLSYNFSWKLSKRIFNFAIPIVPGLLIIGFWNPLSRNLVSHLYALEIVGYLAFALKITSLLAILNGAINLAWNPMLFEAFGKPGFAEDFRHISVITGKLVFWGVLTLTLLAPEITTFIGTDKYSPSIVLIGFIAFQGGLEILRRIRGFGPLLVNKTYLLTVNEIIGIIAGSLLIIVLRPIGIIGIGIAFLATSLLKYIFLVRYTMRQIKINCHSSGEVMLLITLLLSIAFIALEISPIMRYILLLLISIYSAFSLLKEINIKMPQKGMIK